MGLEMVPHKTEAVLITRRMKIKKVSFKMGTHIVEPKKEVKVLGIVINHRLCFSPHLTAVADKTDRCCTALARLMPNVDGPRTTKRRVISSVMQSIILYEAPVWVHAMRTEKYRKTIAMVQRNAAIRVCCAYNTISESAVLILASLPPIDLMAEERSANYKTDPSRKTENR